MLTKQGLVGQSGPCSVGLGPAEKRRALVNFKCKEVTEEDQIVEFSIYAWAASRTASCAGWTPETQVMESPRNLDQKALVDHLNNLDRK